MFILSELQDNVPIRAAAADRRAAVLEKLKAKYTDVLIKDLGLSLFVTQIVEIIEYEVVDDKLVADVVFEVVFYRCYEGEVVVAKVVKQDEDKIVLEDELLNTFEAQAADLFENCEFEGESGTPRWIWNYKDNQLPFVTGEKVRAKVKGVRYDEGVVDVVIDDQGLGPLSWWD